jgi:hypothetical protein
MAATVVIGGPAAAAGGSVPRSFIKDFVKPVLGDFAAVNQNDTVVTDESYGVVVEHNNTTSPDLSIWAKSAPATPYHVIVFLTLTPNYIVNGEMDAGITLRESATGKLMQLAIRFSALLTDSNQSVYVHKWTNATTFSSSAVEELDGMDALAATGVWLRIGDDGVNVTFDASADGARWRQLFSEARGTFFTTAPDQVGFGITTRNLSATFFHWEETA